VGFTAAILVLCSTAAVPAQTTIQEGLIKVNDYIYQAKGFGNTVMVVAGDRRYDQMKEAGWPGNHDGKIDATILFDDKYEFELGSTKFVVFHTPGETYDQLSVWIPRYKAVHVADNFYDSFPNMYTLRGTKPRWALDYVESINRITALEKLKSQSTNSNEKGWLSTDINELTEKMR